MVEVGNLLEKINAQYFEITVEDDVAILFCKS